MCKPGDLLLLLIKPFQGQYKYELFTYTPHGCLWAASTLTPAGEMFNRSFISVGKTTGHSNLSQLKTELLKNALGTGGN